MTSRAVDPAPARAFWRAAHRPVVTGLVAVALVLLILSALGQAALQVPAYKSAHAGLIMLFYVEPERSVVSWFETGMLLFASFLLLRCGAVARSAGQGAGSWIGAAAVFAYMALDEAVELHVRLPHRLAGLDIAPTWVATWWFYALVLIVAVTALFWRFVGRLPKGERRLWFLSGALFLTGAVGMEAVVARIHSYIPVTDVLTFQAAVHLEEGLEMAGAILFVHALLGRLGRSASPGPGRA